MAYLSVGLPHHELERWGMAHVSVGNHCKGPVYARLAAELVHSRHTPAITVQAACTKTV